MIGAGCFDNAATNRLRIKYNTSEEEVVNLCDRCSIIVANDARKKGFKVHVIRKPERNPIRVMIAECDKCHRVFNGLEEECKTDNKGKVTCEECIDEVRPRSSHPISNKDLEEFIKMLKEKPNMNPIMKNNKCSPKVGMVFSSEKLLENIMKARGYKIEGSGTDLLSGVRDMSFKTPRGKSSVMIWFKTSVVYPYPNGIKITKIKRLRRNPVQDKVQYHDGNYYINTGYTTNSKNAGNAFDMGFRVHKEAKGWSIWEPDDRSPRRVGNPRNHKNNPLPLATVGYGVLVGTGFEIASLAAKHVTGNARKNPKKPIDSAKQRADRAKRKAIRRREHKTVQSIRRKK